MLYKPTIFDQVAYVRAAQSTRHGGVSKAPYHTLNLGKSTEDHPDHVAENRRRFCEALGFSADQLAWSKQVHGEEIRLVSTPGGAAGYDAMITAEKGILLAVSVADCAPILVYDTENRAMGAIHAGWRGTAAGLVAKTLALMRDTFGTRGADCRVFIGACIDVCSFEVGEEVAAVFDPAFKQYKAEKGKFFVDLKKANATQCLDFGIQPSCLEISPYCTLLHSHDFFSHRADKGLTGRMLAAIGVPE